MMSIKPRRNCQGSKEIITGVWPAVGAQQLLDGGGGSAGGSAGIHLQPALQVQGPQPETPVVECALESRPFWRWKGNYLFTQLGVGEHLVISHTTILTVNI